jgi:hypothetical protein
MRSFAKDADEEYTMLANVKILIWSLVGIGAGVGLIYLANERSQPFIVERTIKVEGTKIMQQFEIFELARKQQLWLNLIKWIAVAILIIFAGLMILWFSFPFAGEKLPKEFDDLLKYLCAGVLGALLGVICSPTVDSMAIKNAIEERHQAAQPQ